MQYIEIYKIRIYTYSFVLVIWLVKLCHTFQLVPPGDVAVSRLSSEWTDGGGNMSPVSRRWNRLTPACLLETAKANNPLFPGCKEEMVHSYCVSRFTEWHEDSNPPPTTTLIPQQTGRSVPCRSMDIDRFNWFLWEKRWWLIRLKACNPPTQAAHGFGWMCLRPGRQSESRLRGQERPAVANGRSHNWWKCAKVLKVGRYSPSTWDEDEIQDSAESKQEEITSPGMKLDVWFINEGSNHNLSQLT